MENISPFKPLSDAISAPIVDAYKAGGLGLTLVFVGTLLLLSTLLFGGSITAYVIGILGALIILTVLYLFYFQSIKPLKDLNDRVKKNQETINTVQQAAIQMTDLAYNLQSLAFKNADEVASFIMILRFRTKDDQLVRCKHSHGKEDPQAVQCRI